MASLVVGGVTIPVAISSPAWSRSDAVDRGRMFDGTFFASESGGASRDWTFSTPPVTQSDADTYIAALGSPVAKLCSGDIIQIPTMCSPELPSGKPTRAASSNRVVLDFMLHEIQPAKVLLRYAPGDTITGEAFTRATTAFYMTTAGVLVSAAINAKRDTHFTAIGGTRSLLLERGRTNALLRSQEFDNATWTKDDATISANAATAPDSTVTGDKLVEAATTAVHMAWQATTTTASTNQAHSVYVKAGERTWCYVLTKQRDGTVVRTWVNLSTGAIGTTGAGHTVRVTALQLGWYRIEVVANSLAGAVATYFAIGAATADNVSSYLGDITKGIYVWGAQHEQDAHFASSYIPTAGTAVTRLADFYSLPFTTPPQEMTVYAKFVEGGTTLVGGIIYQLSNAAAADPRLMGYESSGFYRHTHRETGVNVFSALAVTPTVGQVTEFCFRLFGDGSVDTTQSIDSGTATSGAQSASLVLATAWSGQLCWLNSEGTTGGHGFTALQSFKIVAGARSLTEMRSA